MTAKEKDQSQACLAKFLEQATKLYAKCEKRIVEAILESEGRKIAIGFGMKMDWSEKVTPVGTRISFRVKDTEAGMDCAKTFSTDLTAKLEDPDQLTLPMGEAGGAVPSPDAKEPTESQVADKKLKAKADKAVGAALSKKKAKAHAEATDDGEPLDEDLVEQCIEVIRSEQKASVSLLQRRLRLGYGKACRIIDEIEKRGLVGPSKGSEPRDILMDLEGETLAADPAPKSKLKKK